MSILSHKQWKFINDHIVPIPSVQASEQAAADERAYRNARRQAEDLLNQVRGIDPTHNAQFIGPAQFELTLASQLEPTGNFAGARNSAETALAHAQAAWTDLTERRALRDRLLGELDHMPGIPLEANLAESLALATASNQARTDLQPNFPTRADLTQIEADIQQIRTDIATYSQRGDAARAELAALQSATTELFARMRVLLDRTDELRGDAAYAALSATAGLRSNDITGFTNALASNDPAQIHAEFLRIGTVRTAINQFETQLDAVWIPKFRADLARLNIGGPQRDALENLAMQDAPAYSAAMAALEAMERASGPAHRAATIDDRLDLDDQLTNAMNNVMIVEAHAAANPTDPTMQLAVTTARNMVNQLDGQLRAVEAKQSLLAALTSGPLSPSSPTPLPANLQGNALALFNRFPKVADIALKTAAQSSDPGKVLEIADLCCGQQTNGFQNVANGPRMGRRASESYAVALTGLAGKLPPDMMDGLQGYLATGAHLAPIPALDKTNKTPDRIQQDRVKYLTSSLLGPNGTLDIPSARTALQNLAFHPDTQDPSNALMLQQMSETLDWLENTPEATALLQQVTNPNVGSGRALVSKDGRRPQGAIDADDVRQSVLNAMMTPIRQGKAGSCFATAPVIQMRKSDPLGTMKAFCDLAQDGIYRPRGKPPVHAVLTLPTDENPLVRSLEATVATAGAESRDSAWKTALNQSIHQIVHVFESKLKKGVRKAKRAELVKAIRKAVEIRYDPTATSNGTGDGQSKTGRHVLRNAKTKQPIESLEDYQDLIREIVTDKLDEDDIQLTLGLFGSVDKTANRVEGSAFAKAVKMGGHDPWNLQSGGYPDDTYAITKGSARRNPFMTDEDVKGMPSDRRAAAVLGSIAKVAAGQTNPLGEDTMWVGTNKVHGFNYLPGHPDLQKLTADGPDQIQAAIQREVTDRATALAQQPVPTERLAGCMDELLSKDLGQADDPALKTALQDVLRNGMPTQAMTAADFVAHCKTACQPVLEREAEIKTAKWFRDDWQKKHPGVAPPAQIPRPSRASWDHILKQYRKITEDALNRKLHNKLLETLAPPSFVFADTNWGDADGRIMFAVAADPVTGKATLCRKTVPPGTLSVSENDTTNHLKGGWGIITDAKGAL